MTDHLDLYRQLTEDDELWDMPRIAAELSVKYQTVKSWRRDSSRSGPHPNCLPRPDQTVWGKPLWKAGRVRLWAMHTDRMDSTGQAQRAKPPGRNRATPAAAGTRVA